MIDDRDRSLLRRSLELARRGRFHAPPNPLVGAVLVRDGEVIGEGFHRRAGGPHAEVEALAAATGDPEGATLYVNLEPCRHQGRTPPCTESILAAGIHRVVVAHRDLDERASGGLEELRRRGVRVDLPDPDAPADRSLVEDALVLNARFLVPLVRRRPLVTLKWAMSLDGRIATRGGDSQWISSKEGRAWALELRDLHDAIVVGSGTVLADDPRLDRRHGVVEGPITRVVVDRRLRWVPPARMFDRPGPVLVFTAPLDDDERRRRAAALADHGAAVFELDDPSPGAVVAALGGRGVGSVLVEGGGTLLGGFVDDGCLDRVGVCCAPRILGGEGATSPVGGRGIERLTDSLDLVAEGHRRGPDWIIEGLEKQCLRDLWSSVVASSTPGRTP